MENAQTLLLALYRPEVFPHLRSDGVALVTLVALKQDRRQSSNATFWRAQLREMFGATVDGTINRCVRAGWLRCVSSPRLPLQLSACIPDARAVRELV